MDEVAPFGQETRRMETVSSACPNETRSIRITSIEAVPLKEIGEGLGT